MKELNYYEMLGVNESSSLEELRAEFRKKISECFYREGELEKIKAFLEAFNVLSNPDDRACYELTQLIKNGKSTASFDLLKRTLNLYEEYGNTSSESANYLLKFLLMLSDFYYKMSINVYENIGKDDDNLEAIRDLIDSLIGGTINLPKKGFGPRLVLPEDE